MGLQFGAGRDTVWPTNGGGEKSIVEFGEPCGL